MDLSTRNKRRCSCEATGQTVAQTPLLRPPATPLNAPYPPCRSHPGIPGPAAVHAHRAVGAGMMTRFARIGIGPGRPFDPNRLDPATRSAIEAGRRRYKSAH